MERQREIDASQTPNPDFTPQALELAFFWARDRVASVIARTPRPQKSELGKMGSTSVLGAFVSFKKKGRLRSCMGYMSEGIAFGEALDEAAVSAAKDDPRFPPISVSEFYDLDMEIWALGSLRETTGRGTARRDSIVVGRDGVQILGRGRRGLLLPSVAIEQGWDVDRLLDGVCDKAGLARGAWKDDDVKLFAFEGLSFKKPFVWNLSRNPLLKQIVEKTRVLSESEQRATFSLAPEFFQFRVPFLPSESSKGAQENTTSARPPAVAGAFYPGTKLEQNETIRGFDAANAREPEPVKKKRYSGALVPHAGWFYSGRLAARVMSRVEPPELIVVFAPKHRREGANMAVMPLDYWDFGGGQISNDMEFVDDFVRAVPVFQKDSIAHRSEHSIEVQLPLIARYFPSAKVVGALIGAATRTELVESSDQFAEFLAARERSGLSKPLLLVSSDMNHYVNDATTRRIDQMALDALETTDPDKLRDVVLREGISMCGILPAYFVLTTLKRRGEFNRALRVGYATSGDASGDRERVVGYAGYCFE